MPSAFLAGSTGLRFTSALQKGVVTGVFYRLAPTNIIHSWAEVKIEDRWVSLEGVILDKRYLEGLRTSVTDATGAFLGFGVGTDNLAAPAIEWREMDTSIQMTGVNQDFGIYDDPDAFYARHGGNLSGIKDRLFRGWVRHRMNRRLAAIRASARRFDRTYASGPFANRDEFGVPPTS